MLERDLEGIAVDVYRRHHLDPADPVGTAKLVRLELGADALVRADLLRFSGPAATFLWQGRRRIALRPKLPIQEVQFFVGHELAHVLLEREGCRLTGRDLERACDYLGACLMAPEPAARRLHAAFGFDPKRVARAVVASQTWAALRLAEATGTPAAALSPVLVRARDAGTWSWPDDGTIRAWARRPGPGLQKVRITDGRGRLALVARGA